MQYCIYNYKCPKCGLELVFETDIKQSSRPKCSKCKRKFDLISEEKVIKKSRKRK